MNITYTLISHHLCPYVQRAAIAMTEKAAPFQRIDINLSAKPDWFKAISPLGKVPVLRVEEDSREHYLFESTAILEYLDEVQFPRLHPVDAITRADNRAWMEFGSRILDAIARFYTASDGAGFRLECGKLTELFAQVERRLGSGPFFNGSRFSLVDTVFGPIFRYFDVFDTIGDFGILRDKPAVGRWRQHLAQRGSVRLAVSSDYEQRLREFLILRGSYLSALLEDERQAAMN